MLRAIIYRRHWQQHPLTRAMSTAIHSTEEFSNHEVSWRCSLLPSADKFFMPSIEHTQMLRYNHSWSALGNELCCACTGLLLAQEGLMIQLSLRRLEGARLPMRGPLGFC